MFICFGPQEIPCCDNDPDNLDHGLLTQSFRQAFPNNARHEIRTAAGGEWNDDADWPVRICFSSHGLH